MATVFLIKNLMYTGDAEPYSFLSLFGSEDEFIFNTKIKALETLKVEQEDYDNKLKVVEIDEDLATFLMYGNQWITGDDSFKNFYNRLDEYEEKELIIKEMVKASVDEIWSSRHYLHYVQKFVGFHPEKSFIIDGPIDPFSLGGLDCPPDEPDEGGEYFEFKTYSQYLKGMIATIERYLPQEEPEIPQQASSTPTL